MSSTRRRYSLRARLTKILLSATLLVWGVAIAFIYLDTRKEVGEMLDAHLAQSASLLLARGEEGLREESAEEHAPALHRYARRVVFQVWEDGSRLRLHALNAPQERLSPREEGFADTTLDGRRWRVFSAWTPDRRYLVQVAERYSARSEIAETVVEHVVIPMAFVVPVLAAAIWFAVWRTLAPLREAGAQVAGRDPARLDPVQAFTAPVEIEPLLDELNRLFARVNEMLDSEKRFTSYAAHELRTPLAALRAQAQVAHRASDETERARALELVMAGCDRAAHLVEQLLSLARAQPGLGLQQPLDCDLADIAADAIALIAPLAVAKSVDVALVRKAAQRVRGDPALLDTLVRNLVDNAVRYSRPNTAVTVEVADAARGVALVVQDEGPGVAEAERDRMWEPFWRAAGSGEPGSGLGLSIVRRIADLHKATLTAASGANGRGLRVTVVFPAAAS